MDPKLDTGHLLYQVRVRTRARDSVGSLYERIMDRSVKLITKLIDDAANARLRPRPQGRAGSSYYSSTNEDDRLGEILLRTGKITLDQLESPLSNLRSGKRLGVLLVEAGRDGARALHLLLDHPAPRRDDPPPKARAVRHHAYPRPTPHAPTS